MTTLFTRLQDWMPGRVQQVGGVEVSYTRGATTRTITAVVGRTVFASQLDGGPRIEFGDRDYLIEASELAAFGDPEIGDRVTETLAGASRGWEGKAPGTGEAAWRWSDPQHTRYRVHTTQVS